MRLSGNQIETIRRIVREEAGDRAQVRVFGSRARDDLRGGDLDLLVECDEHVGNPALLSARISARISRTMRGRAVDVVLSAPNLRRLPIHGVAERDGLLL